MLDGEMDEFLIQGESEWRPLTSLPERDKNAILPTGEGDCPHFQLMKRLGRLSLKVIGGRVASEELEEGFVFSYPNTARWTVRLGEFVELLCKVRPAYRVATEVAKNGKRIRLSIEGPKGTKAVLRATPNVRRVATLLARWSLHRLVGRLTDPIRTLPDFLVIGAVRCGTTSLWSYLSEHPCIGLSQKKETEFFEWRYPRGLAWYRSHFPTRITRFFKQHTGRRAYVVGEITPSYLFFSNVPRRVHAILPKAKLIVLLRNPVDLAYSWYQLKVEQGLETLSFEEALDHEQERLAGDWDTTRIDENPSRFLPANFSYRTRGIYIDQLQRWRNLFPQEQMLVVQSEQFYKKTEATLERIIEFLSLPTIDGWKPQDTGIKNAVSYPPMNCATRKRLTEFYAPHNARLYRYLGVDFNWDR
jgi:hypothetical protein